MGYGRVVAATVVIAAGVAGVRLTNDGSGGGAPAGTANIWIENGGGACAGGRSNTPIAYAAASSPDRICGTFDAAWDAMNSGDTARVSALGGDFTSRQTITGDKTSNTFIIGEGDPNLAAGFDQTGDYGWLEEVDIDIGCGIDEGQDSGADIDGNHSTWVNIDVWGCRVSIITGDCCDGNHDADFFEWHGGTLGEPGTTGSGRDTTDGEPLYIYGSDNTVIDGVTFSPQTGRNGFHLETIRLQADPPEQYLEDVVIKNNYFVSGSSIGSGYIFGTSVESSSQSLNGLLIYNNVFGEGVNGSLTMQTHSNVSSATGWVFAYNTWQSPDNGTAQEDLCLCPNGVTWVGNLGPKRYSNCDGTFIKNVWQNNVDTSCGTDTWVSGSATDVGNLGINSDERHIDAGSPAIDAGETPGASDYCTDAALVNSLDFEDTVRPQGSVCDAGADER